MDFIGTESTKIDYRILKVKLENDSKSLGNFDFRITIGEKKLFNHLLVRVQRSKEMRKDHFWQELVIV